MKAYTEYLLFHTKNQRELVNITNQVQSAVHKSEIKEGFCLVNAMHITSSVFINDDEPGLHKDFIKWLEVLAPARRDYLHHQMRRRQPPPTSRTRRWTPTGRCKKTPFRQNCFPRILSTPRQ